jgi:hypothetical protein
MIGRLPTDDHLVRDPAKSTFLLDNKSDQKLIGHWALTVLLILGLIKERDKNSNIQATDNRLLKLNKEFFFVKQKTVGLANHA